MTWAVSAPPMTKGAVAGEAAVDLDGADEFAVVLFDGEDLDAAAEGGDDVEQGGAGGVHAERVEDEVGVGEEERGAEEEGGGGDVSGNGGVDGVEVLAAGDGERAGWLGHRLHLPIRGRRCG